MPRVTIDTTYAQISVLASATRRSHTRAIAGCEAPCTAARIRASFERLAVALAGESYADLSQRLTAELHADPLRCNGDDL